MWFGRGRVGDLLTGDLVNPARCVTPTRLPPYPCSQLTSPPRSRTLLPQRLSAWRPPPVGLALAARRPGARRSSAWRSPLVGLAPTAVIRHQPQTTARFPSLRSPNPSASSILHRRGRRRSCTSALAPSPCCRRARGARSPGVSRRRRSSTVLSIPSPASRSKLQPCETRSSPACRQAQGA